MNRSFFRKVSFGLGVYENLPDNPLDWAINQISFEPDMNWKGPTLSY